MSHTRTQEEDTTASLVLSGPLKTHTVCLAFHPGCRLTIGLKTFAFLISNSVGLLSDAMESGVNLIAAFMALAMLTIAARPPDEEHAFGHSKAEYFASGVEGTLILLAAASITGRPSSD